MSLSSLRIIVVLLALVCIPGSHGQSQAPGKQAFDFGTIGLEEDWQHTFQFTNNGSTALEVRDVNLTPPLVVTQMPARVLPGQRASVTVRMETPRDRGDFEGAVAVNFKGEASNPWFSGLREDRAANRVRPDANIFPFHAARPEKTASIEIVNHEADPFEILRAEYNSPRFRVEIKRLSPDVATDCHSQ